MWSESTSFELDLIYWMLIMTDDKKWKDYFLSSGLPLEYEVFNYLNFKNCITYIEHSYLRNDENLIENSFSIDMTSTYLSEEADISFKMLIECKYRNENTKWLFIPGEYIDGEISNHSFLHPNDYFIKEQRFRNIFKNMCRFAPLCLKGVEISNGGKNTKSINQAISQLSFAMADIVISDMKYQLSGGHNNTLFLNIPIIITTANLYRMNEGTTINDIKASNSIEEISKKENCIILQSAPNQDLSKHNLNIFSSFLNEYEEDELNRSLISGEKDIRTILELKAFHSCPKAIIVMHYENGSLALKKLLDLFDAISQSRNPTVISHWRGI